MHLCIALQQFCRFGAAGYYLRQARADQNLTAVAESAVLPYSCWQMQSSMTRRCARGYSQRSVAGHLCLGGQAYASRLQVRWHFACRCRAYQAYMSMFCCTYLISVRSGRCSCMSGQHKLHLPCTLCTAVKFMQVTLSCHAYHSCSWQGSDAV